MGNTLPVRLYKAFIKGYCYLATLYHIVGHSTVGSISVDWSIHLQYMNYNFLGKDESTVDQAVHYSPVHQLYAASNRWV